MKISDKILEKYSSHIKYGDLFTNIGKAYLLHTISADLRLGAGIAREFDRRLDMRSSIKKQIEIAENEFLPNINYPVYLVNETFNVVTKKFYYQKPTLESFKRGLGALRTMVSWYKAEDNYYRLKYNKICMPLIGCGLDKMDPNTVIPLIDLYLGDLIDYEIYILDKQESRR